MIYEQRKSSSSFITTAEVRAMLIAFFKKFADEFGYVMLHYCSTPAYSGHILNTLIECPYVKCVDNWQGYKTLFNEQGEGFWLQS